MHEYEKQTMTDDEELIDVLLDFIIVAANLSKKINRAVKHKQNRIGGKSYVENERNGNGDYSAKGHRS